MKILTGYWVLQYLKTISKHKQHLLLTAEVEVDGGGDLAELVLGAHLVQPGIALDHVVDLEHNEETPVYHTYKC